MSLLSTLTTDDSINNDKDTVGGNGGPVETALYDTKVAIAYITKSQGGALGLVLTLKTDTGKDVRQTLWMTSGTAKGCKNYYEKDGEKNYLPGFVLANNLALLTVGKEIAALETETKTINVWSSEAKAEVPTKVEMVMDLIDQDIVAGIFKQVVDKTRRNEATGIYEPTGETREENEIDKFFRARDKMTAAEIRAQAEEPTFYNTWDQKWTGKTREKAKAAGAMGSAGVPKGVIATPGTKKPATSLFA